MFGFLDWSRIFSFFLFFSGIYVAGRGYIFSFFVVGHTHTLCIGNTNNLSAMFDRRGRRIFRFRFFRFVSGHPNKTTELKKKKKFKVLTHHFNDDVSSSGNSTQYSVVVVFGTYTHTTRIFLAFDFLLLLSLFRFVFHWFCFSFFFFSFLSRNWSSGNLDDTKKWIKFGTWKI